MSADALSKEQITRSESFVFMGFSELYSPYQTRRRLSSSLFLSGAGGRLRRLRCRAHLVVAVVALRPLRPRRAGGQSYSRPMSEKAGAPLCAARRLAARAVPPKASLREAGQAPALRWP